MTTPAHGSPDDLSTAQLLERLTTQVSTLVQHEVAHATAEVKRKGARMGVGLGISGAGLVLLVAGGATLVATAVLAVVAVVLLVVRGGRGVLALVGVKQAQHSVPVPQDTLASVARDVTIVKESAHR